MLWPNCPICAGRSHAISGTPSRRWAWRCCLVNVSDGVLKELTVFALVYNLVRMVMLAAAQQQRVALERISFVDALRWLSTARPGELLPPLVVHPYRPNRVEPRAVKRRPKPYPLLTKPRRVARNALIQHRVGA